MKDYDEGIYEITIKVIKKIKSQLDKQFGEDKLFGFALATDDDVMSLYHVVCTRSWVQEKSKDYKDIGYISVEWEQSGDDRLFNPVNELLSSHYDKHEEDFFKYRDMRFTSLVQALKDCRDESIFDEDTLLSVGSTDPSPDLEALEMRAVDLLNKKNVADKFADALGYSEYHK